MKKIKTIDAVGIALCHDVTRITKELKHVLFKKGHVIRTQDVDKLLDIGKDHIYVFEPKQGFVHEDDAAFRLKDIVIGQGVAFDDVDEGKIVFRALHDGLFKIDQQSLFKINMIDDIVVSVIYNNKAVKKGDAIGAAKAIPLMIDEKKLIEASECITSPIISVKKFEKKSIAIVTTGNEIYYGRIQDRFEATIREKLKDYDCDIIGRSVVEDDAIKIQHEIKNYIDKGAQMILCTGGMSVDPDDLTPTAIKNTGATIVTYGTPVLPGAMFLMAYLGDIPIMGLPGSVIAKKITVFDKILPRILAGEKVTKQMIASLAEGGFLLGM